MNTFSLGPGEKMALTPVGLRIDTLYNNKEITQWYAIQKIHGENILISLTNPGYDGDDPLKERRHPESDVI